MHNTSPVQLFIQTLICSPGTHDSWVAQGNVWSVEGEVYLTLLHIASARNWPLNFLSESDALSSWLCALRPNYRVWTHNNSIMNRISLCPCSLNHQGPPAYYYILSLFFFLLRTVLNCDELFVQNYTENKIPTKDLGSFEFQDSRIPKGSTLCIEFSSIIDVPPTAYLLIFFAWFCLFYSFIYCFLIVHAKLGLHSLSWMIKN